MRIFVDRRLLFAVFLFEPSGFQADFLLDHANPKMARPRTNSSGNLVVTVLLHENLGVGEAHG